MSFEHALAELEEIVKTLESGVAQLEDSIKAYERGTRLKAHCEKKLQEAQTKVETVALGPDGAVTTEPSDVPF